MNPVPGTCSGTWYRHGGPSRSGRCTRSPSGPVLCWFLVFTFLHTARHLRGIEFVESFADVGGGQGGCNADHEFFGYRGGI
ncbi:MAG TPA: hypothetical protein VE982_06800 [Gaiellaceae bacterium]|nr:hypothetical protein [Gaiellaceae bacterium]